jgi:hypothetical protein
MEVYIMGEVEVFDISWEEVRIIGAVFIIENLASFMVDIDIIIMEIVGSEMGYFEWVFIIMVRDEALCIVITNIAVY